MARNALTIREMGENVCWMLVKQAMGIPDAKMPSDFMRDKVALLLFARSSLPERLCTTAAVRQMGGSTIYQGGEGPQWRDEARSFQTHLFPILGYFLDCLYLYGFPTYRVDSHGVGSNFPLINAGCNDAHPAHALADLACMLRITKDLHGVKAAWIGCANGTLHSLIESTLWFPFDLSISLPPRENDPRLEARARELGTPVRFFATPEEAVSGAQFVFAGRRPQEPTVENAAWSVTRDLFSHADREARLLLSATPLRAIPVAPELMSGKRSMLVRQAEYRLCVHKRILHWVFSASA